MKRHLFASWMLLLAILTHLFVGHHEGSSELLLCRHADGRLVLESTLGHHDTENVASESEACEHSGCDDLHLSFDHPEQYLSAKRDASQLDLNARLILLAWLQPLVLQPLAVVFPTPPAQQPNPPPPEPLWQQAYTTTHLLI